MIKGKSGEEWEEKRIFKGLGVKSKEEEGSIRGVGEEEDWGEREGNKKGWKDQDNKEWGKKWGNKKERWNHKGEE